MHEMSVAIALLEQVEDVARESGARRIVGVSLRVGVLEHVMPDALTLAWLAVAEEGIAAGAALEIEEQAAVLRCRGCGTRFTPPMLADLTCPDCHRADADVVAGRDVILKSVVCDVPEEAVV